MGYLFKEVLKTLCGVNQWDYAVFWKIGCQNPKLLIWEECFYTPIAYNASWGSTQNHMLTHGVPPGNKACALVNQMLIDKHVNIVGEGLVGRAAFTGNNQWILSENFTKEPHPPEVVKEACQQFSGGMQTVAVIPVLPHGVVQFGSHLAIMENMIFINEVKTLILQMGYANDGLLSDNYTAQETRVSSTPVNSYLSSNTFNSNPRNQLVNTVPKAEVIPSNPEIWLNQQAFNIARSILDQKPSSSSPVMNNGNFKWVDQEIISVDSAQGCFSNPNFSTVSDMTYGQSSGTKHDIMENRFAKNELKAAESRSQHENLNFSELNSFFVQDNEFACENLLLKNTKYEDQCVKPQSGDDLFDILGVDFKNELFRSCWTSSSNDGSDQNTNIMSKNNSVSMKTQDASSEIYTISQGNTDGDIFSMTGSDHLLDAVVSKVHSSSLDDNVSCKTTLAYPSSSGFGGVSDQAKEELFGVPKYMVKAETSNSCSFRSGCSKVESATISGSGSIYGSQISSWIEKGREIKPSSSVSTGYSKKTETTSKTSRKRLKPGENPRPRPKDRQMIQDRVKELREIVPNGAKCSIDALLERTIKHMLFLQSVTKHADKLKQTGESKIVNKDGGLLLRDNLEGGATWAYEVGSQSMVCPIIVEDLNQPRQMLVEMLCEERGLFLEIADMIRGMGLTILKGVMETRDNKIWARFSVEANRDVTRMEVFISLVRLLEQTAKNGVPLSKSINNETSAMVQQFHQLASIPVTGSSRSLQ